MKVVALREAKESLSSYVEKAQRERVLITRHGKPAALMIGVEGEDIEALITAADPNFWRMIEARRREPTLSLAEAKMRLARTKPGRRPRVRPRRKGRSISEIVTEDRN